MLDRTKFRLAYASDKIRTRAGLWFPKYLPPRVRYWVVNYEVARHIGYHEEVPAVPALLILERSDKTSRRTKER